MHRLLRSCSGMNEYKKISTVLLQYEHLATDREREIDR